MEDIEENVLSLVFINDKTLSLTIDKNLLDRFEVVFNKSKDKDLTIETIGYSGNEIRRVIKIEHIMMYSVRVREEKVALFEETVKDIYVLIND